MSLIFGRQQRDLGDTSTQLTPPRTRAVGSTTVSADTAMRMSTVWACLQLRAGLISTLPVDTYRDVGGGVQVEAPPTPFLLDPAGDGFGVIDWLHASQLELDRVGNAFGRILARDGMGFPSVVQLAANQRVQVIGNGPTIKEIIIEGDTLQPKDVWRERAHPIAGFPLGLSPIANAAMSIGNYLSAQQFGLDWFANGAIPSGELKNTERAIDPAEAQVAKDRFKAAIAGRDIWAHGSEWAYDTLQVKADESQFLETMRWSASDVCRFLGVPADMVDAGDAMSGSKITYANITQRNLQMLIMHLGPAIIRREFALSATLPKPRQVKLNADALLRMDPASRTSMLVQQIASKMTTVTEARALDNRQPLTEEQEAEFARLFPKPSTPTPTPSQGVPA